MGFAEPRYDVLDRCRFEGFVRIQGFYPVIADDYREFSSSLLPTKSRSRDLCFSSDIHELTLFALASSSAVASGGGKFSRISSFSFFLVVVLMLFSFHLVLLLSGFSKRGIECFQKSWFAFTQFRTAVACVSI